MDLIYTRRFQGGSVDIEEHRLRNMLPCKPPQTCQSMDQGYHTPCQTFRHGRTLCPWWSIQEDNEVHSGKAEFGSFDDGADLTCIGNDFFGGV
eukprot:CCRYP_020690-RB/>CCRYP_020690-RB protein AED:0.32 eAED:0.32 QI:705/0.5/0.66/1/0/0/3/0/92